MPLTVTLTPPGELRPRRPVPYRLRNTGSPLTSIGVETQPSLPHRKTSTADGPRRAVAAATPIPFPLILNNAGASGCTRPPAVIGTPLPFEIVNVATPAAVPGGMMKLICPGET